MLIPNKVYDFPNFLLSQDFLKKNLTFREILGSRIAECTTKIAKCHTIYLKNLLKTKK